VPTIDIGRGAIDYRLTPASEAGAGRRSLVFLHEGLGSLELWRGFPDAVRAACGNPATLVYSRHGYGRSAVVPERRPVRYMHDEALDILPALLAAVGIERPILVGHSDGASIALVHAGAGHSVAGLVLLAPHAFVEDRTIAGIAAAKDAYATGDLRERLARYHDDPDATFRGWNDVWLSPAFRSWSIADHLSGVSAPVLLVQGTDDEYGTMAQLDTIESQVRGPVERVELPGGGHAPHLDAPAATIDRVARFVLDAERRGPIESVTAKPVGGKN
jgi:pimeloyl-ACP methyl ester carboxylesterase